MTVSVFVQRLSSYKSGSICELGKRNIERLDALTHRVTWTTAEGDGVGLAQLVRRNRPCANCHRLVILLIE